MGLFTWYERATGTSVDAGALGGEACAMRIGSGCVVPAGCVGLVFCASGHARRVDAGARVSLASGESACCFHPGPYAIDIMPFAAAPEAGLHLNFAINTPDPRVAQQRFDLYLMSEADGQLDLAMFRDAIEQAIRMELEQGNLELPPCVTLEEWNQFRAGLNRLLYVRFGVTVDDCLPVDLGESVDYAQMLLARAAGPASSANEAALSRRGMLISDVDAANESTPTASAAKATIASTPSAGADRAASAGVGAAPAGCAEARVDPASAKPAPSKTERGAAESVRADAGMVDALALRRLFLELPCLMFGLRMAVLPPGAALFRQHKALLQRLDLVSMDVNTMPALALIAPGQPLDDAGQLRRARHCACATRSLDEAWALLARVENAGDDQLAAIFDEADRIIANLERDVAARRIAVPEPEPQA